MPTRKRPTPFDIDRCRLFAVTTLSMPPALPRITRPERHGGLLYAFVLPLSVCPSSNLTGRAGMPARERGKALGEWDNKRAEFIGDDAFDCEEP